MERVKTVSRHLSRNPTAANEGEIPKDVAALPQPPLVDMDGLFPTFPQMLDDSKKLGGLFSYKIMGGRRMTVIQDPNLYEIVYSPGEFGMTPGVGQAVIPEMAKLATAWFGIPRDIGSHTNDSLYSVRRRIGPRTVVDLADKVGNGVKEIFDKLGNSGVVDLVQIAHGTFWPVNEAMFGKCTISPEKTPGADDWFHQFDENLPAITGGVPLSAFEDSKAAYDKIVHMFKESIDAGNHLDAKQCPVMHARFNVNGIAEKFDHDSLAKFMVSLYWAPQGNTLSQTWWVLLHILADPRIKAKVEDEVRNTSVFKNAPDANGHWPVEDDDLPYTRACMYEVLRMYIANLTHRKVTEDIPVKVGDKWMKVPKGDMLTVASYLRHWDPEVYDKPEEFRPERWLGTKKYGTGDFLPFAHGRYSCSGKFLAMLEIPMLVGQFFRDFDTELVDPVPEADWDTVVASVRPKGWPYHTNCRVRYVRRAQ